MRIYILVLSFCLFLSLLSSVTIYNIQYTTVAGTGTYPSLYSNQTVTTQGIVTATGYVGTNGFYISEPDGGAWKGILIYTSSYSPNLGDLVQVTGLVYEYYGLTEIKNVTSCTVISSGNVLPQVPTVTVAQACAEAYESVLLEVQNVSVTSLVNQYSEWTIADASGSVIISDFFFDQNVLNPILTLGTVFSQIRGIGNYSYNLRSLNPRSQSDLVLSNPTATVTLPSVQTTSGSLVSVPLSVSTLTPAHNYTSYSFQLNYNPYIVSYSGYSASGTLSASGTVTASGTPGVLNVGYSGSSILLGTGSLLNLSFTALTVGQTPLTISNFVFNATPAGSVTQGQITVNRTGGEVPDTLSVIQRPLLNIPAIVVPGTSFTIECVAPPGTTSWAAQLQRGNLTADLSIINTQYATSPPRWLLTATVPDVNVFELYDLKVTASGGINDRTRHSVQVLPTLKTSYYFAQVTDIHMPTHILYPATGYDTDSTETVDFREVINDLNLIRPEFVLVTGDLVNEGELEDFNNVRAYTKAKRLLGELEIPCYMVSGNHDIGGWTATPPPAGTSRKSWWRNFGWSWLSDSSANWPYHTQDYSFTYGQVHYIGLEAYDNYESYLTNIYGPNSFTDQQMQWLAGDLAASGADTNVLFYHYDFDAELDMAALNVDMGLWGHIHADSGSLATTPYNLATDQVCDGGRAYRIVRVSNTNLQPYSTIFAGATGSNLSVSFIPHNYGIADSVYSTVVNNQPLVFENTLVKFFVPAGNMGYNVTGGVLEQVDTSGTGNICYVRVNLTANTTQVVTIKAYPIVSPLPPEQVTITKDEAGWRLDWEAVTHNIDGQPMNVSAYTIEASDHPDSGFVGIGSTPQTSFIDPTTQTKRFYRVKAIGTND